MVLLRNRKRTMPIRSKQSAEEDSMPSLDKLLENEESKFKKRFITLFNRYMKDYRGGRDTESETESENEDYDTTRGGRHSGEVRRKRGRMLSTRGRSPRHTEDESEETDNDLNRHYDTERRGGPSQADRARGGRHSGEVRRKRSRHLRERSPYETESENEGYSESEAEYDTTRRGGSSQGVSHKGVRHTLVPKRKRRRHNW